MTVDQKITKILDAHLALVRTPMFSAEDARLTRRRDRLLRSLNKEGRQRLGTMGEVLTRLSKR